MGYVYMHCGDSIKKERKEVGILVNSGGEVIIEKGHMEDLW